MPVMFTSPSELPPPPKRLTWRDRISAAEIPVWDCCHERTELRRRVNRAQAELYVDQCLTCGTQVRALRKAALSTSALAGARPFDDEIAKRWDASRRAMLGDRERAWESRKAENDRAWWAWYSAYLLTPKWRARRELVMQRARGICEGCGFMAATQVHHRTYDHVGDEFLFELVAICDACHGRLHAEAERTAA